MRVKKVAPPKTFCNIFTQVKYISVKFCQYVASSYLHTITNFGRCILIFNKMALIFLGIPIGFSVSSFKFHKVKSPWLYRQEWIASNSSDLNPINLSRLVTMLESYHKLQPKTIPEFRDALQRIWSALPDKAINCSVIRLLQAIAGHVCQPVVDTLNRKWKIHITDTDRYNYRASQKSSPP